MGITITGSAWGSKRDRAAVLIRLVLLDGRRFTLISNGTRLSLPCLRVSRASLASAGFRPAIEAAAQAMLGVEVRYLALLGFHSRRSPAEFVVAARTAEGARLPVLIPDIVSKDLEDVRDLDWFAEEFGYIESAHSLVLLADTARRLDQSVRDIFARTISCLDREIRTDDSYVGWNQYLEDRAGVGALSTAQGLLCHIYGGQSAGSCIGPLRHWKRSRTRMAAGLCGSLC